MSHLFRFTFPAPARASAGAACWTRSALLTPITRGARSARALLLALAACGLQAQAADLLESWRWAQSHDPQWLSSQAAREQAQARRAQIDALWEPQAQASLAAGLAGQRAHLSNAEAMGQSGVAFDTSVNVGAQARVGVGLQKPLRNPALDAQANTIELSARIGELQTVEAEQALAWRVVQSYVAVLSARQAIDSQQRQFDTLQQAQKEIARRQSVGDATAMDVQEAQARVAALRAGLLQARQQLATQLVGYRQITGQTPPSFSAVAESRALMPTALPDLPQWLAQARAQSTALQRADVQIAAQEAEARRIHLAGTASTLDGIAQAQFDQLSGHGMLGGANQQIAGYLVGVQWRTPLGAHGLTDAREREALLQADTLRRDKDLADAQLESQVTDAWQTLQSVVAQMQALADAHRASQQRLRSTRAAHRAGVRSTPEWLGAEQDAAQAELAWRQMRVQVLLARARLWWVGGNLGDSELQQLNALLQ